jgi:hypothetical protein
VYSTTDIHMAVGWGVDDYTAHVQPTSIGTSFPRVVVIPSIHYMTTRYVTPVLCETVWKGYLSVVWFSGSTMDVPSADSSVSIPKTYNDRGERKKGKACSEPMLTEEIDPRFMYLPPP